MKGMLKNRVSFIMRKFVVGPMEANCYILASAAARGALIIDPGAEPERMKEFLDEENLDLKFIVNTHGHGDHIAANSFFAVPIYIHRLDSPFLKDSTKNLSSAFGFAIRSPEATRLLDDGDEIHLADLKLEVIHTPGHTPGSISLKLDGMIFTGDTLFCGGIGRTDLPDGDEAKLSESIRKRLLVFGDDTIIHPGHGDSSTIGKEKRSNPFL